VNEGGIVNGSQDRDRSVERLLRQPGSLPSVSSTAECLDAETVAAWADGNLSGAGLEKAESHVADCARCQAVVAALIRTEAPVAARQRAPRKWLAWLVPLTAAAAAVAIWIAVPRDSDPIQPSSISQNETTTAPPAASVDSLSLPTGSPSPAPATPAGETPRPPAVSAPPPGSGASNGPQPQRFEAAPSPPLARAKVAQDQDAAPSAARDQAATQEGRTAAAPAATTPSPALNESVSLFPSALATARAVVPVIASPDSPRRWRLAGAVVQYSTDGGSTWTDVFTASAPLTAGTAPASSVCWIVGRGGVVLKTIDGRTFSRLQFPEAVDLATVGATDADRGGDNGR
jgi:hypothetical protein